MLIFNVASTNQIQNSEGLLKLVENKQLFVTAIVDGTSFYLFINILLIKYLKELRPPLYEYQLAL